jgi:hypothetical protein
LGGAQNSTYPLEILSFWEWFTILKIYKLSLVVIIRKRKAPLLGLG